jgi:ABC-type transport system involved in multi-copper enzyme maturation permease subunit
MIFRKIIAVMGAVLTFVLLLYLIGFLVSTFFPNYEKNFFISLMLILLFSFIIRKVYSLIANSPKSKDKSNLRFNNYESNANEDYEYLSVPVKKPNFHFKKKYQNIHNKINNKKK